MTDELAADAALPLPPTPRRPRRRVLLSLFTGFAVFAYALDQLTKLWVTSSMVEGERIPVLPPVLHWYFIRNSGAAFSIGENVTWVFSIIMAAVSIAILFQVRDALTEQDVMLQSVTDPCYDVICKATHTCVNGECVCPHGLTADPANPERCIEERPNTTPHKLFFVGAVTVSALAVWFTLRKKPTR